MTGIQKSVLDAVVNSSGHLSAEEVFKLVRKKHPKVSVGTVYRNLNMFVKKNRLGRVERAGGPDYFDANIFPHDHVFCAKCGKMHDIAVPELREFLSAHTAFRIISYELNVSAVCPECEDADLS